MNRRGLFAFFGALVGAATVATVAKALPAPEVHDIPPAQQHQNVGRWDYTHGDVLPAHTHSCSLADNEVPAHSHPRFAYGGVARR